MADRYWVGGSGTWDASSTTNWSATSGGGGGASVPTAVDAVIVNAASGSPTITVSGTARPCLSLTTIGATCTIAGSIGITVSGSITLSATTTWSNTGTLTIAATSTITTNGVIINSSISSAFSVTLGSALTLGTTNTFTFTGGTLTLSTFTLSTGLFSSTSGTRTFAFGTGNITTRGSGTVFSTSSTSLTVSGTPTVNISNNSATATIIVATGFTEANSLNFNVTVGTYLLTISSAGVFRSLNFTGFAGTWAPGSNSYTFYGNLTLVAGMTYTASTGNWTFANTSGTATITSAAKTLGSITQNGAGGTVALGSALTLGGALGLTITQGIFNTNNFNITAISLSSSGSGVRTISLGSSTLTLSDISTPVNFLVATNLTFNAGTSQINLTGAAPEFRGGSQTFYNVSFLTASESGTAMSGTNIFNNLTVAISGSAGSNTLDFSANQTINGTLNCAGTSVTQRVFLQSITTGTTRTLTVAVLSANNCDFKDITIAGAAIGTAPAQAGDAGGNSGIAFPVAKTVYWNKATAVSLWNDNAWATSPGGTVDVNNFPLAQDTVIFTAASPPAASTVVWDFQWLVGPIDLSQRTAGATMTLLMNNDMRVCGNFTAGTGCTFSATGTSTLIFQQYSGFQFIRSAGRSISAAIGIDGSATGGVSLLDAFSTTSTFTTTTGSVVTNNYALTCVQFIGSTAGCETLDLGSSTVTLTGSSASVWTIPGFSPRLLSNSRINATGSNATLITAFPDVYGTVNASPSGGSIFGIEGAAIFGTISSTRTNAFTVRIGANLTVTNWLVSGTAGNVVTYTSSTVGAQRTMTYNGPRITLNFISTDSINFSYGVGGPTVQYRVYATNSTNGGNNRGIAFMDGNDRSAILLDNGVIANTWTVPANWNNRNNIIYMVGAGGEGRNSSGGGGGGGGGGFTLINNFVATPGEVINYRIGQGFASVGTETGDTGLRSLTVTLVGVTTVAETVAGTFHVFAVPAGTQTGDLMVLFVSCTTSVSSVSGSGWRTGLVSGGLACFFRTASSEPANYTVSTSTAGIASGYLVSYRNAKYDTNTSSFSTVATPATAGLSTATRQNGTTVLAFFSAAFGSTTFSTPAGFSSVASESNANSPSTALFSLAGVASGSTSPTSSTPSGGVGGTGFMFAISPKFQYQGGGGEPAASVPTAPAAGGIGQTFNGGAGGAQPSGGGGGAGGPNGVGGAGGAGTVASPSGAGAGGGGSGGGTAGSNSTTTFGAGGNNSSGTGGGASAGADGQFGGGGAGSTTNGAGGDGGSGRDWENTVGSGGGSGGIVSTVTRNNSGGNYGGGGGGSDLQSFSQGAGAGGAILIVWQLPRVFVSGVTISPGITIG